jgi:acyl-[acyl-carrier-protein]-phospholipid O-acyltransferase/long-chain-fatty-acid--[acyl-carrier-protein] ligase
MLTALGKFMVRPSLWLLTHTLYPIRVRGLENLPRSGPALLVCNHISFVDPFLIGACTRRPIRFLMCRRFYQTRGIHWLATFMEAIPISEGDPPRNIVESLRAAQAYLRQGHLVCIFTEGAIPRIGKPLRFRRGFERITRGLSIPIIPVHLDRLGGGIVASEREPFYPVAPGWPPRIPYPVTVSFGAPLPPDSTAFDARQAVAQLSAEAFGQHDATQRPLPAVFLGVARRNWRRLAMADSTGRELNFGRLLVGAMLFRGLILKRWGNNKMIGVLLPPSVPAALVNIGISMAGRVPVNLNYTAPTEAMEAAIARCRIRTIFTSEKLLARVSMSKRPGMVMIEDAAREFSGSDKVLYALAARLLPPFLLRKWLLPSGAQLDSLATVIFSSGSTGDPKGVMLSHRNIVCNVESIEEAINVDRTDCLLGILPFFHSFGFTVGLWLPALVGFPVVYHANPLESRTIGELSRRYGVTLLISTPTFAWDYVRRCAAEDFASLRYAVVGAEKMKPELAAAFKQKFGVDLFEGYGCTELSPVVAAGTAGYSRPDRERLGNRPGTVGHPIPGVAARVVQPDTLEDLGPEQQGLLLVKGPSVMMGYLEEPEKTRRVITPDGWYITGDIARLDRDGFITVTDRLTRFSKIGGEMVPHLKVEEALQKAAGALGPQLVVTSLSDEQKGERLTVLHTELGISVDELLKRLRDSDLPRLWLPKKENFFQVEALPFLGTGKLDLKGVKETAKRLAGAQRAAAGA